MAETEINLSNGDPMDDFTNADLQEMIDRENEQLKVFEDQLVTYSADLVRLFRDLNAEAHTRTLFTPEEVELLLIPLQK